VFVAACNKAFDEDGRLVDEGGQLIDEGTVKFLGMLMNKLRGAVEA